MTIEIKRVIRYPPETFLEALPKDILSGSNKVAEYVNFTPYIITVQGLSFAQTDGLTFHLDVDGVTDTVKLDNLVSAKGIDYEEQVKAPSRRIATFRIDASSNVSGFQWRHSVTVFRPTAVLKRQLGMALNTRDVELLAKYGLSQALKVSTPEPFNPYWGITEWRTVQAKLTASGTVARLPVPSGKKLILTEIACDRPGSPATAYIDVERDYVESTLHLDMYCLPGIAYGAQVRIVSLDELLVTLNASGAGTYKVRLVYGLGPLTLMEKVMWAPETLTAAERSEAESLDLFDKVEAGVWA